MSRNFCALFFYGSIELKNLTDRDFIQGQFTLLMTGRRLAELRAASS